MRAMFLSLVLMLIAGYAQADELQLILNGKAYHMTNRNYNEKNYGLGLEYDFTPKNHWVTFINGSFFKDSFRDTSRYIGIGKRRRFLLQGDPEGWHFDAGYIVFLMTRRDMYNNRPFPGILPAFSLGKQWFAINATYIPKVSPKHVNLLFFQIMIRVAQF